MRIFKIKTDVNNVQLIQPSNHLNITLERFRFDCKTKMKDFADIEFYVYNPKLKPKNFYSTSGGCLVFDRKTSELCRTVFEMSGEVIPIKMERDGELYILNVLECMNGLDYENTK
ncbi:MAG: hypothetical protein V4667_07920 [Bacteroidota bacterium]